MYINPIKAKAERHKEELTFALETLIIEVAFFDSWLAVDKAITSKEELKEYIENYIFDNADGIPDFDSRYARKFLNWEIDNIYSLIIKHQRNGVIEGIIPVLKLDDIKNDLGSEMADMAEEWAELSGAYVMK